MINRRGFISTSAIAGAAACAPGAAVQQEAMAPEGAPAWEREWAELVNAAKKEGALGLFTTAGVGQRKWVQEFEAAFPGITVEHVQLGSSDLIVPKITQERQAGIYTFDILVASGVIALPRLVPAGVLDPLRPLLFRPDVLDDRGWRNGFEANWADKEKRWGFAMDERLGVWVVNSNLVKDGEIKSVRDLLDPKWKGKIIMQDPRAGANYAQMTAVRLEAGEEVLRKLIIDQEPFYSREPRQIAEALVRDKYAIANNLTKSTLQEFRDAGVAGHVKDLRVQNGMHVANSGALWAVNKAPHPNAAKLLANWLLSPAGAGTFSKHIENNSLRADVEVVDPVTRPEAGVKYFYSSPEAAQPELDKTQQLLNGWLGIKN